MADSAGDNTSTATSGVSRSYKRRAMYAVTLMAAFVVGVFLLWTLRWLAGLVFGAVLVGVFLRTGSAMICRFLGWRHGVCLGLFCLGLVLLAVLFGVVAVPALSDQVSQLQEQLPQSFQALREWVLSQGWGRWLLQSEDGPQVEEMLQGGTDMTRQATTALTNVSTATVAVIFVVFTGLYLAAEPRLYQRGVLWLIPPRGRRKADTVMGELGITLRNWLYGQLLAMAMVGLLSGIGLWILGVPLPMINAVLAGLLEFIPNFGPFAAGLPPTLLALTAEGRFFDGPTLAASVVVLYASIQAFEGYVLTPLIQRRAVELPPALLIVTQLVLGLLLGIIGVMIAAPLTAVVMVLARHFIVVGDVHREHPKDREHEGDGE